MGLKIEINAVSYMIDHEKECQECGWRGMAAELDAAGDGASGQTQSFCPDCGGVDIKDLNPDE
jgi:hypothetical protein